MPKKRKSDRSGFILVDEKTALLREISNDLARHNAEHAQMLDRLEAMHLLVGEFKVHHHTLDDEQLRRPHDFYSASYPL